MIRTFNAHRTLPEYGLVSHALAGELFYYLSEINERIVDLETMHVS